MGNPILKWIISHCKMGKSSYLWNFYMVEKEHFAVNAKKTIAVSTAVVNQTFMQCSTHKKVVIDKKAFDDKDCCMHLIHVNIRFMSFGDAAGDDKKCEIAAHKLFKLHSQS